MTDTEIIEGNKLIAEFMNHEEDYDEHGVWQKLQYHSSWDWLIPAVEKIMVLDNDFAIKILLYRRGELRCSVTIDNWKGEDIAANDMIAYSNSKPINCVWITVLEFIKWYNHRDKK